MTIKKVPGGVLLQSCVKDYPMDWPVICKLWSLFGGKRLSRYKFFFNVSLTELVKAL